MDERMREVERRAQAGDEAAAERLARARARAAGGPVFVRKVEDVDEHTAQVTFGSGRVARLDLDELEDLQDSIRRRERRRRERRRTG